MPPGEEVEDEGEDEGDDGAEEGDDGEVQGGEGKGLFAVITVPGKVAVVAAEPVLNCQGQEDRFIRPLSRPLVQMDEG